MKRKTGIIAILFSAMMMQSCALMFNGSRQKLHIRSMTEGSDIFVDGDLEVANNGREKITVNLKRMNSHEVMIKKEGCKTQVVDVNTKIQAGWVIFDLLINWFALPFDGVSGAWKGFEKDHVTVDLECK
jgi:hypothetical protein